MIRNELLIILIYILLFGCKSNEDYKSIKNDTQYDKYAEIDAHEYNQRNPHGIFFPDKNEYMLFTTNFED
jgi:hypothetical protein